jgi:hypothetical protein
MRVFYFVQQPVRGHSCTGTSTKDLPQAILLRIWVPFLFPFCVLFVSLLGAHGQKSPSLATMGIACALCGFEARSIKWLNQHIATKHQSAFQDSRTQRQQGRKRKSQSGCLLFALHL